MQYSVRGVTLAYRSSFEILLRKLRLDPEEDSAIKYGSYTLLSFAAEPKSR